MSAQGVRTSLPVSVVVIFTFIRFTKSKLRAAISGSISAEHSFAAQLEAIYKHGTTFHSLL